MNIKPLGDRVLLKAEVAEEKTKGGLYIPQTAQEKTQTGVVTAIGESEEIQVKVGDKVMHDKYAGTAITVEGEDYLIVSSSDIIAIVE
ncbi:co-chaperone GroES [Spirochaeta africana]|uniref:Co-chaperonin GroES n=1 Tax=Spirochaeta africana (strain ATCC 700263 / DSM 8902 / Z-7692) TaxID=889378 RepID=H9UGQ6_SPIAZ|nr:co-chaperone GroES [Spirochaeta africana]AFG36699.1 Co-chaperonin GroES [Spirochaeta africana DSM 8902]